jgi:Mg/Co/Ni transporter MgtE
MGVQDSHRIRLLLGYREKTAGGIMTPDFVSVSGEATVAETVEKLRAQSTELETVNYIYTVDAKGGLTGALSMRSLVLADPQTKVHELAEHDLITAGPDEDQEKIADIIAKYDILALPIVDEDNKILGIVTVDDALDVMEEEHTEDLQIVGAGTLSLGSSESGRQSVRTLLLWFLRRELWFVIWALLAFLATMSGNLKLLAPSLVFMPFVLLVATDTVSFALNDLIEYKSSGTQDILRLFGRNLVAAVFVAAAAALLGLLFLTGIDETFGGDFVSAAAHLLTGFAAAVAACFAVIAASVLVTIVARRRLDRDQPLSLTGLTLVAMGFGLAVQIALQLVMALSV